MRPRLAVIACCIATLAAAAAVAQAHTPGELSSADLPIPGLDFGPGFGGKLRALEMPAVAQDLPAPSLPASGSFEQVGHDPLLSRGMNAALAVHGDYAYVGSRTDGSNPNAGVLVVDVKNPAKPSVVHQIGQPNEANIGESSRELRILPDQQLLLVLNHGCSELIHRCANPATSGRSATASNIKFYDIAGANAKQPKLVSTYLPSRSQAQQPHEFFIWSDPRRPDRVLAYLSTPSSDSSKRENLIVTDLSRAREGKFEELSKFTTVIGNRDRDNRLHSFTVSNDGRRMYLAYLGGGFLVADSSDIAEAKPKPEIRLVTPVENRVFWTDPGAHSAAKLPGREHVMMTDEVYGKLGGVLAEHGCPWGWVRFIDIGKPESPRIESEYRLPSNDPKICSTVGEDRENLSSFASHNPTMTRNLALLSWHSAGLEAVDISDPAKPVRAGTFKPEPLASVTTEDPALSEGRDKVVMWSYPIIKDGLIYVVDLRNGLYILKYTGTHAEQVASTSFLEGNSNLGDALRFENTTVPRARLVDDACPEGVVPDSGRTDADGNAHERAIDCMIWWGIANGQSDTRYDTLGSVSRGQMASLVAGLITKAGGALPAGAPDAFSDDNGTVHEASINALAALGVVDGVGGGRFAPEGTVGRGQVTKFLVRGYEAVSDRTLGAPADFFADDNGSTFEQDINRSAAAGFVVGQGSGFNADGLTQRDQMASLLARALDLLVEEGTTPAKEPAPAA